MPLWNPYDVSAAIATHAALATAHQTIPDPLTIGETEVFYGTSPTAWTDLDLSGVVGARKTLVIIKATKSGAADHACAFRTKGDTDEFYIEDATMIGGAALGRTESPIHQVFVVITDTDGKIQWRTQSATDWWIDIMAYIK